MKGHTQPAPEVHKTPTTYVLSAPENTGLRRIAELAPTLKEGELRVLLHLAKLTENVQGHAVRESQRAIEAATKLARSAIKVAIPALIHRGLITWRKGTATQPSAFIVNVFSTGILPSKGGPFTGPPQDLQQAHPSLEGWDSNRPTVDLLQAQGGLFAGPPSTENKELPAAAERVDFDSDFKSLIDRVLSAKPKNQNPTEIEAARRWMHGYACKFPAPDNPNPHPPDDVACAQLLAVAPWPRLERMFYDLMAERQPAGYSWAWFVTVALQRIHGISAEKLKTTRQQLKIIRRGKGEASDPAYVEDLVQQIARGKALK